MQDHRKEKNKNTCNRITCPRLITGKFAFSLIKAILINDPYV